MPGARHCTAVETPEVCYASTDAQRSLYSRRVLLHCRRHNTVLPDEVTTWSRYTVPLPKQIAISGKVRVSCASVAVVLPASSDIGVLQARKEIREALGLPGVGDDPASPAFTITLQLGGAESAGLEILANSDQAYKIIPEAGDTGLRLVALDLRPGKPAIC